MNNFSSWHVGVSAEAFAAALFARYGYNVSVQYGANQPEYDLIAVDSKDTSKMLKISVKGSKDGSWGLTQKYMKNGDYHGASKEWLAKHDNKTIFCLVQFKNVDPDKMPKMYLATPEEIVKRLDESANGRGETILYEHHEWSSRAVGYGTTEKIPSSWKFTEDRVKELFLKYA